MERYDSIVIGAGQSGPPLAVRLAEAGQRVALVERSELGGTCVNNGCIPTKTMVASARAAWVARRAADWGVQIDGAVRVDMRAVKARKDAVVEESRRGLLRWIESTERLELIRGEARFETARRIRVEAVAEANRAERVLEAERFFIDTGASPIVPDLPGLKDVPYLTNIEMMELDVAPEHLIILGGSYIGLEFGQMFRRFGSRVSIIERATRLIAREDPDVSRGLLELMREEQIDVRLGAEPRSVRREGAGLALELASGEVLRGTHLLLALGRVPNTAALDLDAIGVERGPRGHIEVDDTLRSSQPQIWALGEVNGRGQFTHTSYNDYEIVAGNLLDGQTRRVTDRISIYGLFTDPPLGRVGMTEHEARQSGRSILIGTRPMSRVGRARERGETRGFIKLLADADSKQLLGATVFGIEGDEVVHCIADLMYAGAPYTVLQRAVHTHPTVSELLPTVANDMKPLA